MRIENYVSFQKFSTLGEKYCRRTELPLILVNREGQTIYKLRECGICLRLLARKKNLLERNCRLNMLRAVEESFRWGEGYITTCPLGLIIFAVPVIHEQELLGGLISGFAIFPEMQKDIDEEIANKLREDYDYSLSRYKRRKLALKIISLTKTRTYLSFLLSLTRRYRINDLDFLKEKREKHTQQYKIAEFLNDLKRSKPDISRKILDKQNEIIQRVKLGDKNGAREILNEFLGSIFFESGMNFEIIKVRIIELVVIISRAAIEAGVEAKELFGLNYSYLTDLNRVTDTDELLVKLTHILENFINKVFLIKEKKKKLRCKKMLDYVNQNFTRRIKAKQVAEAAALSVSRALHLFKEETGLSLTDYITKLRIDYGKYLLLNTDIKLADLASEAGFYDQSHFARYFKKKEGTTPSHFRLKYKIENL